MNARAFSDFTSLEDLTALPFEERRPGCARALLHEHDGMRASVLRIQPGNRVPAHRHSGKDDLFIGIRGEIEIRWDGGSSCLRQGGFCRVPRGVPHEVLNRSDKKEGLLRAAACRTGRVRLC